jgi:hypothetical protein
VLVRFSCVAIVAAFLVWLARSLGFEPYQYHKVSLTILAVVYLTYMSWGIVVISYLQRTGKSMSRSERPHAWLAPSAPVLMIVALLQVSTVITAQSNSIIVLAPFSACGSLDDGTCVLSIKPRNLDASIWLDEVHFNMGLSFADEASIVGPPHIVPASARLRIVQSPDEPFPVGVDHSEVFGVVNVAKFTCPKLPESYQGRKLIVRNYSGGTLARVKNEVEMTRYQSATVTLEIPMDVAILFRKSTKECPFFP